MGSRATRATLEPIKLDYLRAALCLCGAVYFVFRSGRYSADDTSSAV